ncbi:hypothetical protein [Phyllobacterium sp. K27]
MTSPENLLGFNFKPLTFKELATTFDALRAVDDTLCGFTNQPRCNYDRTKGYNQAGDLLAHLAERVMAEKDEIVKEVRNRTPTTKDERALRFYIIMSDELWSHGEPEEAMLAGQSIVASMPTIEQLQVQSCA